MFEMFIRESNAFFAKLFTEFRKVVLFFFDALHFFSSSGVVFQTEVDDDFIHVQFEIFNKILLEGMVVFITVFDSWKNCIEIASKFSLGSIGNSMWTLNSSFVFFTMGSRNCNGAASIKKIFV